LEMWASAISLPTGWNPSFCITVYHECYGKYG
jgi:hypothetical protein